MSDRDANNEIYAMTSGGSLPTNLTNRPTSSEVLPDWQPAYEIPFDVRLVPISISLVPTFKQCGVGGNPSNSTHAAPLAVPSCSQPVPTARVARVGAWGGGSATFTAVQGDFSTIATEADWQIAMNFYDVRVGSPTGPGYLPNPNGPDMTLMAKLRITDTRNGSSQTGQGTATDLDFAVPVNCSIPPDTYKGSDCSANTTANALMPNVIREGRNTVVQVFRVRLNDAGLDGIAGNADDTLFAQQGTYFR